MAELDALQEVYPDVVSAGGNLLVVTPQLPRHSEKLRKDQDLEFPILYDENHQLGDALELTFDFPDDLAEVYRNLGADIPKVNGNDRWTLPMPARYLVDKEGLIRDAEVNPDYTQRPEPKEMVGLLEMLA